MDLISEVKVELSDVLNKLMTNAFCPFWFLIECPNRHYAMLTDDSKFPSRPCTSCGSKLTITKIKKGD